MTDFVVGIDLGTTNSCISYYVDGKIKIIKNKEGKNVTPSFLFYHKPDEALVGEHAKRMSTARPDFGIYGIKRLIGRNFDDAIVQRSIKKLLYTVKSGECNNPVVTFKQGNVEVKQTPVQLSATILRQLKNDAELTLERKVNKAVITVPAYFNVSQREETLAAAKEAGFNVLKLLNEPTAAALAYYHEFEPEDDEISLVYDLGGGTFDVAILKKTRTNIKTLGVAGNSNLGGQDFDDLVVDYVITKLKENYGFDDADQISVRRIRNKCEDAKKTLSTLEEADITLNGIIQNHHQVEIILSKDKFENLINRKLEITIKVMDKCLNDSGLSKNSIKNIILAGGSSRIPKIRKMISDYFQREDLNKLINPDECVGEGAAIQAAMLSTNPRQSIHKIKLLDVIPISLGVADFVDRMDFTIRKNTVIPVTEKRTYVTHEANQDAMALRVYEGERLNAMKNKFLGDLVIHNITPAPPRQCEIIFTMSVDENSILTLTAQEKLRNNIKKLEVDYTRGQISELETIKFLTDAEAKEEDRIFERFANYKSYLLTYCTGVIHNLETKNLVDKYRVVYRMCHNVKLEARQMGVNQEKEIKNFIAVIDFHCRNVVSSENFSSIPSKNFTIGSDWLTDKVARLYI